MDFYERVKKLAKEKHLLLMSLLESIGINYETYRSQKRQGNLPRADDAVKIAKALDTTVEYLVEGSKRNLADIEEIQQRFTELQALVKRLKKS